MNLLDAETGEPRIFYHGTKDSFDTFDLNPPNRKDAGNPGEGIYMTPDPEGAYPYGNAKRGDASLNVMPLYVRMRNPYIEDATHKASSLSKAQARRRTEALKAQGYDGIIAYNFNQPDWQDNPVMAVVFLPEQVESAVGHAGTFSKGRTFFIPVREEGADGCRAGQGLDVATDYHRGKRFSSGRVFYLPAFELIEDFFKAFKIVPDAWEGDLEVRKFLKYRSDFECVIRGLPVIPARPLASLRYVDEVEKDDIKPTRG